MIPLLLAFLAATNDAPRVVTLFDDAVLVGAAKIRTLDIPLPEEPGRILCSYEVTSGLSGVRVVLLRSEEAARWLRGEAHDTIAATPYARQGAFSHRPLEPDHYQLVLDNRLDARAPAEVHLLVRVVFTPDEEGPIQTADPRRAQILVYSTLAFFAAASLFAAWQYRAVQNRRS